jgi:hypothetical protein
MNANTPMPPSDGELPPGLSGDRVTRGTIAKWTNSTGWVDRDGLPLPTTVLVIGFFTCLRRWQDKKPEYKTEHPLPDPEALNAAIPISEWERGLNGEPRPPWKLTYVVYMIDAGVTGALYTWQGDSYGAMLAYNLLEEAFAVSRMMRGPHVFPIAELQKRPWKSPTFGPQVRPHFHIIDWKEPRHLSMPQAPAPQLPGPATTAAPIPASTPVPSTPVPLTPVPSTPAPSTPAAAQGSTIADHLQPVKPITVGEFIKDKMPPWA